MKKTKIILPAIALLAVSGIASVTGTVAWFTAASSAKITVSNVAAISTSGDLNVKVKAGNGVKTQNATSGENKDYVDGTTFELYDLRDSSVDVITDSSKPTFYKAVINSDDDASTAGTVSEYAAVDNSKVASTWVDGGTTKNIYYAAEWEMVFTTASTYGTYDLFFDGRATKSNLKNTTAEIYKSFRVAMICGSETLVWSPNGSTTATYVNSKTTTGTYDSKLHLIGEHEDHFTTSSSQSTAESDITFLASGMTSTVSKTVKCIAWFEGTDPTCLTDYANNLAGVEATSLAMSFYAVSWTTGA